MHVSVLMSRCSSHRPDRSTIDVRTRCPSKTIFTPHGGAKPDHAAMVRAHSTSVSRKWISLASIMARLPAKTRNRAELFATDEADDILHVFDSLLGDHIGALAAV
ncbi:MAG TPA: hypothetical protein VGE73_02685, partial [Pseudolabrys sp.]